MSIRVGIFGYGNLGKGVECAVKQNDDFSLVGVFTRRSPESVKTLYNTPVYSADDVLKFKGEIDVMVICGGSATDLPEQTPYLAQYFNVIDSFDTHAKIPEHFANVDAKAKESGKTAMISVGWDPGMFSLARAYASAVLPRIAPQSPAKATPGTAAVIHKANSNARSRLIFLIQRPPLLLRW